MAAYTTLTDQELADSLRSGDQLAFKELYNRYWTVLLDTAYKRLDSTEAAEEVVQDLFVSLFIKRESLKITYSLDGYLKNALKYKIFDIFRSQYIHNKYVDNVLNQNGVLSLTPEHEMQVKELALKIDRATQKMPEKCREVFLMSRMENLSNKSIASKLSISVSTVEKHISKAMHILEKDFKEYHLEIALVFFYLLRK
ncbi:RNA polymerase sigma-70 factor [Mucilaginibacter pineti]|nr:RNA polymerase sigma-70 factor [Mucilaginibacter pineti]